MWLTCDSGAIFEDRPKGKDYADRQLIYRHLDSPTTGINELLIAAIIASEWTNAIARVIPKLTRTILDPLTATPSAELQDEQRSTEEGKSVLRGV